MKHKSLAFVSVLAVSVAAAAPPPAKLAAKASASGYDVKGSYYESCACAVSCPCAANKTLPTEGHCDAVSLFHIDKGTVAGNNVDGLNIAVVLRSPKGQKVMDAMGKGEMDLFTAYIDEKATPAQREAMPAILGALFGTQEIKGARPPQFVPMSLTVQGDVARFQIAGGSKLAFEIENVTVGDMSKLGAKRPVLGNRIVLTNSAPFPFVRDLTQGLSHSFKYADLGTTWEYKDRNAFFGTVAGTR